MQPVAGSIAVTNKIEKEQTTVSKQAINPEELMSVNRFVEEAQRTLGSYSILFLKDRQDAFKKFQITLQNFEQELKGKKELLQKLQPVQRYVLRKLDEMHNSMIKNNILKGKFQDEKFRLNVEKDRKQVLEDQLFSAGVEYNGSILLFFVRFERAGSGNGGKKTLDPVMIAADILELERIIEAAKKAEKTAEIYYELLTKQNQIIKKQIMLDDKITLIIERIRVKEEYDLLKKSLFLKLRHRYFPPDPVL